MLPTSPPPVFRVIVDTAAPFRASKVLENGIVEAIGDGRAVGGDESSSLSQILEHASSTAESNIGGVDSTFNEPLFTLGISLDGKEERILSYYSGQVRALAPHEHVIVQG